MISSYNLRLGLNWAPHMARHMPGMALQVLPMTASRYLGLSRAPRDKFLVGTHHKALTVYLGRVFRTFAALTGRNYSFGTGDGVDSTAEVLIDHHSRFDFDALGTSFRGLHIRRDPRDLLVSCMFYHQKSSEAWLHEPREELGGRTYQEHVNGLPDNEARLLFELENSAGYNISNMLAWDYQRPGITEFTYEELISPDRSRVFKNAAKHWFDNSQETTVLLSLFDYFSITGAATVGSKHVRNPRSGQWREHFTPPVAKAFDKAFPDAVERLGYQR